MAALLPTEQQCNSLISNSNLLMLQQRCWQLDGCRLTYSSQIDLNQAAAALVGTTWQQASHATTSPWISRQVLQHLATGGPTCLLAPMPGVPRRILGLITIPHVHPAIV